MIYRDQDVVFEIRYRAYDDLSDPTFDDLALETHDFFYWAAKVLE